MAASVAAIAVGCSACEKTDTEQDDEGQAARAACTLDRSFSLADARSAAYANTAGKVDTAQLQPGGPNAVIALSAAYVPAASHAAGALLARIIRLDSTPYEPWGIAGDTTYVWTQECADTLRLFFVNSAGVPAARHAAWVGHAHSYPDSVFIQLRDSTVPDDDAMVGASVVPGFATNFLPAGPAPEAPLAVVTYICARCEIAGWCTGR